MKKFIALLTAMCLVVFCFTACSSKSKADNQDSGKLSVIVTIFPAYDWVKQITAGSDNIDLTLLFDNSADLHNYQPTADDIVKITDCDMFIYVGGESDEWVENVLKQSANENMIAVNLLDAIGENAKTEEHKEGMEEEHPEDGEEHEEYDEHVWLSIKNTQSLCIYISEKLSSLDNENADLFSDNTDSYISSLKALDEKYQSAVEGAGNKTLVFADRFPFRYLTDDYGIDYYAAFAGCSAESEASFETISFLAKKVDELNLKYVMTIEGANHNIAQTVIDNTAKKNQQILVLDSMQSKTFEDIEKGETYLSIMEKNLTVLQQALA
ncbi:MAG: metal ABC transporter substrate-binding protein [Eubacterium sp.]